MATLTKQPVIRDEVIHEVREIKKAISAKYDNDIDKLLAALVQQESEEQETPKSNG